VAAPDDRLADTSDEPLFTFAGIGNLLLPEGDTMGASYPRLTEKSNIQKRAFVLL
jgi:hypothetical protein